MLLIEQVNVCPASKGSEAMNWLGSLLFLLQVALRKIALSSNFRVSDHPRSSFTSEELLFNRKAPYPTQQDFYQCCREGPPSKTVDGGRKSSAMLGMFGSRIPSRNVDAITQPPSYACPSPFPSHGPPSPRSRSLPPPPQTPGPDGAPPRAPLRTPPLPFPAPPPPAAACV